MALKRLRQAHLGVSVLSAYLFLLSMFTVATFLLASRVSNQSHRIHASAMAECRRVNALRRQDDENSRVLWGSLVASGYNEQRLAVVSAQARRPAAVRTHRTGAMVARTLAATMTFTGLTNCRRAVDQASSYVPPHPRAFRFPQELPGSLKPFFTVKGLR